MKIEFEPKDKRRIRRVGVVGTAVMAGLALVGYGQVNAPRTTDAEGSPAPSAVDLGSPAPETSQTPEGQEQAFHLNVGDSMAVLPGDVIVGDVAMSNEQASTIKFLYDTDSHKRDGVDNTHTGMLVDVQVPGWVHAPYGGDVLRNVANREGWMTLKANEMTQTGCVEGCVDGVDIIRWTGFETTVDQAGTQSSAEPTPTPSASETPMPSDQTVLLQNILRTLEEIKACTCAEGACPIHPSPTPTASPTATPEACPIPGGEDTFLDPGDELTVRGPFVLQGDVFINGNRRFDNNADTFADHIVRDNGLYRIRAPYGADVTEFCPSDSENLEEFYQERVDEHESEGRTMDPNSLNR